ncbi:MAG TPA: hypothetical protein VL096_18360, partial [Pirellulaceae bacterium]|nr:hypothetical protein [Pirellulaceae bacterium]
LLDPLATETIVVLPALSDRQQIAWETRGLQAVELPAERRHLAMQNAPAYLVVGARYQAIVKRVERIAGVPQVRLADVLLSRQQDGGCFGIASFDLEPAGLTQCQLELPEGYTLLHSRVAELPALLSRVNANRWQLMLHHDQLPQHIEVVFRVPPDSGNELQAPTLVNLPVERTLWTVATASTQQRWELVDSERLVDASRQTLYRLKNAAALLEQAAGVLPESDTSEVASWYLPWARRGVAAKAAFAQQESDRESPSVALTHEMRSLAQDADVITQQWGVSPLAAQAERESIQPAGDADLMPLLSPATTPALRAMLPGSATALTIQARRTQASPLIGRWVVGLVIVAILLATSLLQRWPLVADAAIRYPQALGMVVGLTWWLLLQPGFIGLAIVLLFAISTLRWPWPMTGEVGSTGLFASTLRYRNRR